ncbi:hypothetical protein BS47DRAFT_1336509 [Hydnum rufescens UP504]|uniref:Uncharacterized protein n=1 Tax=Hydnum rufescens UP504 TaxID=1448309 RepID=A0A9P6B976_9AGAM|nr:hypothetical protein BS47DRAFT_1336509 [Hydnum rufescens UP504]
MCDNAVTNAHGGCTLIVPMVASELLVCAKRRHHEYGNRPPTCQLLDPVNHSHQLAMYDIDRRGECVYV